MKENRWVLSEISRFAHRKETLRSVPLPSNILGWSSCWVGQPSVCCGFQLCCLFKDPLDIADLAFHLGRNTVA